ncbi:hypothetical protein JXA70_05290 [candidate division KSB1 bacterium]|nr:hypothetical protein [candidate division KSB1 bacterium]
MKKLLITWLLVVFAGYISGCSQGGSSNPILILAPNADFGTYTAEILKAEGFNAFTLESPYSKKLTPFYLKKFDLIFLAECKPESAITEIIEGYVHQGGNLIAFRPDSSLSRLFGIKPTNEEIIEGYIRIDPTFEAGKGLTSKTMQFHGTADIYSIKTATNLAALFAEKTDDTTFPAVVRHNYGAGHAIAFLYNLPKSIVYTRQGNPLFAGIEKDGIPGLRAMDLFTDGWVDTSANTINQADQQMSLLSHCIQELNKYSKPNPRFWYFPDTLKCLAVLDNDGEDNNERDFEPQFRDVDAMGAKMTLYLKDVEKVSKSWVNKWTAKGFEISGHPDDTNEAGNPVWAHMDSAILRKKNEIASQFGLPMRTVVNHWFVWCGKDENGQQDFGAQARLEEKNGIEMDANYAVYDINSNQPEHYLGSPGINQGNYIGSGLVMKYADVTGKTVQVYQRFNAVYDQQYNEGSTPEKFFECFKGLVDRSLHDDIYSVVSIKAHNNEYYFSKKPLQKMLVYANRKGVPVWTALKLLDFLKMKDEASFSNISWTNNLLRFTLNSSLTHNHKLTFMVPAHYNGKRITGITINDQKQTIAIKRIKGLDYALASVKGGKNYSILAHYAY